MRIFDFDIKKGIYSFEFNDLNTETHSHPVVEIVNATNGTFSLENDKQKINNLVFAIIEPNTKHKVFSKNGTIQVLMIESHNSILSDFLKNNHVSFENGVFLKTNFASKDNLYSEIKKVAVIENLKTTTDERVNHSIQFIEENELEYKHLISTLTSKVFLSDSRLSHLFKEHIGISIKKYLVWNKLRKAINMYLNAQTNLTDVSLKSGFFDQAHLSNSFKTVLGISPSKAYNSRILQA